jgi:putative transposase
MSSTNAIESFSRQMRKIIKTRGHFPNDDALVKLLWLGIVGIEERRAAERAAQAGKPSHRKSDRPLARRAGHGRFKIMT